MHIIDQWVFRYLWGALLELDGGEEVWYWDKVSWKVCSQVAVVLEWYVGDWVWGKDWNCFPEVHGHPARDQVPGARKPQLHRNLHYRQFPKLGRHLTRRLNVHQHRSLKLYSPQTRRLHVQSPISLGQWYRSVPELTLGQTRRLDKGLNNLRRGSWPIVLLTVS